MRLESPKAVLKRPIQKTGYVAFDSGKAWPWIWCLLSSDPNAVRAPFDQRQLNRYSGRFKGRGKANGLLSRDDLIPIPVDDALRGECRQP